MTGAQAEAPTLTMSPELCPNVVEKKPAKVFPNMYYSTPIACLGIEVTHCESIKTLLLILSDPLHIPIIAVSLRTGTQLRNSEPLLKPIWLQCIDKCLARVGIEEH